MSSYKINFTKTNLERIIPPQKTSLKKGGIFDTYYDTKEKGLVLLVSNGKAKTFYLYMKVKGKPERIRIGSFPTISIEQARKDTTRNRSLINQGLNPNEEKNRLKKEITFKELFDQFMDRYSKKFKRSWQYDEREINKFLPHWFNRKVSQISKQEIQTLHEKIGENNGIYQANRLLERIRAIYNKAIEWGLNVINPTQGIKKFREQSRDRFIQADELPYFWKALAEEQNETIRDYIIVSLLTGARKSNVLSMRWEDLNLDRKEWRIPLTKNNDPLVIPLAPVVLNLLEIRRNSQNINNPWVFSSKNNKSKHLAEPKRAWRRILQKATISFWQNDVRYSVLIKNIITALPNLLSVSEIFTRVTRKVSQMNIILPKGLMDIRLHDLRRTLGSWQAATGATTALIGRSLGHKSQQATAVYERLNIDPVRQSMEKAAEAMLKFGCKREA